MSPSPVRLLLQPTCKPSETKYLQTKLGSDRGSSSTQNISSSSTTTMPDSIDSTSSPPPATNQTYSTTTTPTSPLSTDETSPPPSSPYTNLSTFCRRNLQNICYFILCFQQQLSLPQFQLVNNNVETSILQAQGQPYEAIIRFLASVSPNSWTRYKPLYQKLSKLSLQGRLSELSRLVNDAATSQKIRSAIVNGKGGVVPMARPMPSVRDSKGVWYTWLRGREGVPSDRVFVSQGEGRTQLLTGETVQRAIEELESNRNLRDVRVVGVLARWIKYAKGREEELKEEKEKWERDNSDRKSRKRYHSRKLIRDIVEDEDEEDRETDKEEDYIVEQSEEEVEDSEIEIEDDIGRFVSHRVKRRRRSLSGDEENKQRVRRSARLRSISY